MHCFRPQVLTGFFAIAMLTGASVSAFGQQATNPLALNLPSGALNGSNNISVVRGGITAGGWTAVFGSTTTNSAKLGTDIKATASNANALNIYFPFRQTGPVNPLAISIPIGSGQQTAIDQEVAKLASTAEARTQLRTGVLQVIRSGGGEISVGGFRLKGGIATYSAFTTRTTQVPDGTQTVTEQVQDGTERYSRRIFGKTYWLTRPKYKTVTKQVPKFKTVTQQVPQGQFFEPYFAYRR